MARPGYNDDDSKNTSVYTPRSTAREQGIMQNATVNIPRNIPRVTQTRTENVNNNYDGYKNANQQMAASLMNKGALTSGALGGTALWRLPESYFTEHELKSGINPENTFHSTFVEGQQAYSPTGILTIEGENGIPAYIEDEDGNLIPNPDPLANNYKIFNTYGGGYGGGGGGGGGYGYGGGGGGNAAAYAMMNQGPKQLGAGESVPGQAELLDYMINVNSNNPFTQLAMPQMAAGGIMGLMR